MPTRAPSSGQRQEPGDLGAVGRLEDEILRAHGGAAGDRRDRWTESSSKHTRARAYICPAAGVWPHGIGIVGACGGGRVGRLSGGP